MPLNAIKKLKSTLLATLIGLAPFISQAQLITIEALDITVEVPDGFVATANFNGIIHPQTFSTIKYREEILSLKQLSTLYTEQLDKIISQKEVNISGRQGLLIQLETTIHGNAFNQWTLMFGDDISTIILEATTPKMMGDELVGTLKNALLSTRWLRLPKDQQFQGLPFVLDESEQLKIIRRTENSVILADMSQKYDETSEIKPLLVVSTAETAEPINEIEALSNQLLRAKRFDKKIEKLSQQADKVDKIIAFHVHAKTTDKVTSKTVEIYQTVAYQKKKFLLIQGLVEPSQAKQFWPQFEQVTKSIKFKAKN